jgi:hypothetical protein
MPTNVSGQGFEDFDERCPSTVVIMTTYLSYSTIILG